jgi:hypothetical protein
MVAKVSMLWYYGENEFTNVETEGECEYIYRMQNTVDHTNISEIAKLLGAKYLEPAGGEQKQEACGESCDVGAK